MSAKPTVGAVYGETLATLNAAAAANDLDAFHAALGELQAPQAAAVTRDLRALAGSLDGAMRHFRQEFRIAHLAEREVPDARARLNHVLTLTDEAAHRTLDLIERSGPLAERTAKDAAELLLAIEALRGAAAQPDPMLDRVVGFLQSAQSNCGSLRSNLNEVILAQTYQDLTGQIIRGVVKLVGEVEGVLEELLAMTGAGDDERAPAVTAADDARGHGPAIPGVTAHPAQQQEDIDALMAGLGL